MTREEHDVLSLGRPPTAVNSEPLVLPTGSTAGVAQIDALSLPALPEMGGRLARRHRDRDRVRRWLLALGDMSVLLGSLPLALLVTGAPNTVRTLAWGGLTLPGWLLLLHAYGLYDRDTKRISHTTIDDFPPLFHAVLVGSVICWLFFDIGPSTKLAVHSILVFGMTALLAILMERTLIRTAIRRLLARERVLIVGGGALSNGLVRKMRAHPEYGLEPIGIVPGGVAEVADAHELKALAQLHRIDRIMLANTDATTDELLELLSACRALLLKVSVVPTVFEAIGPATEVDELEGITVLGLNPPVLPRSSRFIKRCIDVLGAGTLLLASLPPLLISAIAIKLDSRGPVFFRQRRVGKGGQVFRMIKLRTMVDDAERLRETLISQSEDPHWMKLDRDPRVTRVGALLRRSSLDEIPQLWNVLRGEMSLVGPRPLPEPEDRLIEGWRRGRLDLTPGITGYWQVLGRTSIPFTEMVKLDYVYVTNWSLWTDVRLILRTLPVVLSRRGVN